MKKIKAIIKGRKFAGRLFDNLKERQINRALEAASDDILKQKEDASIAYEQRFQDLAGDKPDYQAIISDMLVKKQTIIAADRSLEAINEIRADLNAEVPETEE